MGKPESTIENYLRRECIKRHFMCLKFTSPSKNGVPDRIVIGNGKTVFVETKAPGKTTRALQDYQHKKMKQAGAVVYVADTKDAIDAVLDEISTPEKQRPRGSSSGV